MKAAPLQLQCFTPLTGSRAEQVQDESEDAELVFMEKYAHFFFEVGIARALRGQRLRRCEPQR